MFWYILFALIALSILVGIIIAFIRKDPLFFVVPLFTSMFLITMCTAIISVIVPSIEDTKYTETLQLLPLSDETPDKYMLVDSSTNTLSFKVRLTYANGITTEEVLQATPNFAYINSDPGVEYEKPTVDIYTPTTSFFYPAIFHKDIKNGKPMHSFYVLNLPSRDSIIYEELKLNDFSTLNLQ